MDAPTLSRADHNRRIALELAANGITVFSVRGDKRPPPGFPWKDRATADPAEVAVLWDA